MNRNAALAALLSASLGLCTPASSLAVELGGKGVPGARVAPALVTGVPQFNDWLVSLNADLKLPAQDLAAISYQASQALAPASSVSSGAGATVRWNAAGSKIEIVPEAQAAGLPQAPISIPLSALPELREKLSGAGEGAREWLEAFRTVESPAAREAELSAGFDGSSKSAADPVSVSDFDPVVFTMRALGLNLPENLRPTIEPGARERQQKALLAWHESPKKTYVFVNSYSFKDDGTPGLNYYDMRPLAQILWAADPGVDVIFVTAMPVDESMIRHVLRGHPDAEQIRRRVHFVSLNDEGTDFLSQKLLDPKHAGKLEEIRRAMAKTGAPAALYPYMGGPYEWQIAARLGIPDSVYAAHPSKIYWGTKSGGRKVFKAAMERYRGTDKVRLRLADGAEDLYELGAAARALEALIKRNPQMKKVAVKLNLGSSGEGNIFPSVESWRGLPREQLQKTLFDKMFASKVGVPDAAGRLDSFVDVMGSEGAAIEQFIPGIERASFPSVQMEILPDGSVKLVSSHEQILIDRNNYVGATLSANKAYRAVVERAAVEAAKELAARGVVGRFGTDFAAVPQEDGSYDVYYIENNIRLTGTTHPMVAAEGLTGGTYERGKLRKADGQGAVRYKSMDHDVRPNLRGLSVDGFLAHFELEENRDILFDPERRSGVLFHLLPAVKAAGNVGYTIIASSLKAVQAIQELLTRSLNRLEVEYLSGGRSAEGMGFEFVAEDARREVEAYVGHAYQVKLFQAFLAKHQEHLYGRDKESGIVFHPQGYSLVGRSEAERGALGTEALRLLKLFAAEATNSSVGL